MCIWGFDMFWVVKGLGIQAPCVRNIFFRLLITVKHAGQIHTIHNAGSYDRLTVTEASTLFSPICSARPRRKTCYALLIQDTECKLAVQGVRHAFGPSSIKSVDTSHVLLTLRNLCVETISSTCARTSNRQTGSASRIPTLSLA